MGNQYKIFKDVDYEHPSGEIETLTLVDIRAMDELFDVLRYIATMEEPTSENQAFQSFMKARGLARATLGGKHDEVQGG